MMRMRALRNYRRRAIAGFTLIEVLVVIIIITVLFAIAAPSWNALMNRQRVNTVREQAVQLIRQAQNDARRTRVPKVVIFDNNNLSPRGAILNVQRDATTGATQTAFIDKTIITNWTTFGEGDIRQGLVDLSTTPAAAQDQLVFDSNGFVDQVSIDRAGANLATTAETNTSRLFAVKVRQANTSPKTNKCVVVKTILGAVDLVDSDECEAL